MDALPTILDIEASGFGRGSYPIEIGFSGQDGGLFCSLIVPEGDWVHWDASAEALHGISRNLLLTHGKPARWMAEQLNTRLRGQVVYCDGWGHDFTWLNRLYEAVELRPSFRLDDLRGLLSEDEAERWKAVTEAVRSRQQLRRHRASSDARVLQLALGEVKAGVSC
jgi:hypothetical protein